MSLFVSLLFGAIGGVYLAYARRVHEVDFLVCGIALMVYPYFFSNILLIVVIGVVVAMIPIARRRGWI